MPRAFGTTPHEEIARAFEAENRQHTFVEAIPVPSGGSGGPTVTVHTKKYELRVSQQELLTLLDSLTRSGGPVSPIFAHSGAANAALASRQLRSKILATLGLYEEG